MTDSPRWKERLIEQAATARLEALRTRRVYPAPSPLHKSLMKAVAPLLKEAGPTPGTLAARWVEIVGEKIARITEPVRVAPGKKGATLFLRAPSAAAPLIQHAAEHIKEKVGLATGANIIAIKIDQTGLRSPPKPSVSKKEQARTLSLQERTELVNTLKSIDSPVVRKALEALGEAVLINSPPSAESKRREV